MIKRIVDNPGGEVNVPHGAFPANQVARVDSLKGVIGPTAETGYDARPIFASQFTAEILEQQLPDVIPIPDWKKSFKVKYPDACGTLWHEHTEIMVKYGLENCRAWKNKLAKITRRPGATPPA